MQRWIREVCMKSRPIGLYKNDPHIKKWLQLISHRVLGLPKKKNNKKTKISS